MVIKNYDGPPLPALANDFIKAWRMLRDRFETALEQPSLSDEEEKDFFKLKVQILQRSRRIDLVSEGQWGIHGKVKGLLNTLQSLDYLRQESRIIQDNVRNLWHDSFIQASKMAAVFDDQHKKEAEA